MKNILVVEICVSNGDVEFFETLFKAKDSELDNFASARQWFSRELTDVVCNIPSKYILLKRCTDIVMVNIDHIVRYRPIYVQTQIYNIIVDGESFDMKVLINKSLVYNMCMSEFDEKLKETAEKYSYDLKGRSESLPMEEFKRLIYKHLKKERL